jgi:hypothetical protein
MNFQHQDTEDGSVGWISMLSFQPASDLERSEDQQTKARLITYLI